jgi:hypothetical protein
MREVGNGSDLPGCPGCFVAIVAPWFVIGAVLGWASCGPAVSTSTRAEYTAAALRCDENEQRIIAREGTTEEADHEAMDLERARCSAELAEILASGADGGTP